jgi:hypothetical protein
MTVRRSAGVVAAAVLAACSFDPGGLPPSSPGGADAAGGDVDAAAGDEPDARRGRTDAAPDPDAPPDRPPGVVVATAVDVPPSLDGEVDDWEGATFVDFAIAGAAHLHMRHPGYVPSGSLSLAAKYDADFLYFAVIVQDDAVVSNSPGDAVYEDDSVSLFFDGEGDGAGAWGFDDHEVAIGASGYWEDTSIGQSVDLEGDVDLTEVGYVIEVSILRSSISGDDLPGRVGFDFALNDDDGLGSANGDGYALWYQAEGPHCDDCCPEAEHAEAWCDTSIFGLLLLE